MDSNWIAFFLKLSKKAFLECSQSFTQSLKKPYEVIFALDFVAKGSTEHVQCSFYQPIKFFAQILVNFSVKSSNKKFEVASLKKFSL